MRAHRDDDRVGLLENVDSVFDVLAFVALDTTSRQPPAMPKHMRRLATERSKRLSFVAGASRIEKIRMHQQRFKFLTDNSVRSAQSQNFKIRIA
jgi:hypothetical protein